MAEHKSEIWTEDDGITYWDCNVCEDSGYSSDREEAEQEAEDHLLDVTDAIAARAFLPRKPRRSKYSGFNHD